MAYVGNSLYPPVIDTYMPAFVRTSACRVYFSISKYNTTVNIKYVQISIVNQSNNVSALDESKYPNGVKVSNLYTDPFKTGDNIYYVVIYPTDLDTGVFDINQFYKVQLRLVDTDAKDINLDNQKEIASWLTENQRYFSEWSRVCLIRGIEEPKIYLKGFREILTEDDVNNETMFTSEVIDFIGSLYFNSNNEVEDEYLESYQIKIFDRLNDLLVYETEIIYTNEFYPNEINYTLKYLLKNAVKYRAEFTYTTNNGYSETLKYHFYIVAGTQDVLHARIVAEPDIEYGRIRINIDSTISEPFLGNLAIRRSSSKDNFLTWEDVHIEVILDGESLHYTWYDYTVESGILYNYAAQQINYRGNRGPIITLQNKIMMTFDDMFLTRDNMQINIRFNPSISSFKKTVSESKTETIGSKYPYIRRNANIGYKQFPISGLITAFMDDRGIFISKEKVFGENKLEYDIYENENNIIDYNNFIYEKEFRDRVMDFLYENNIKLFRSTTEGNILVKLMDISFTPNQTLGRMLYTFSATAYEIDDCTIENYSKYGILDVGDYSVTLERTYLILDQLYQETFTAFDEVKSKIQEKHKNSEVKGYLNDISSLKWIRIQFESPPYLIKSDDGVLKPLEEGEQSNENTMYGYIVIINKKRILVSFRGYYELDDPDAVIEDVSFPVESVVTIDYLANSSQKIDTSLVATKYYYYTRVGQLWGSFDYNESISHDIYMKYYTIYEKYYERLVSIDKITIESDAGTVLYVKDSFEDNYFRHVIGSTGVLEFYDTESVITGLILKGRHLVEGDPAERNQLRDTEFYDTKISVPSLDDVENPQKNYVYYIESEEKNYIYYKKEWFVFNEDHDVECSVPALIDYIFEYVRGEY